MLKRRVGRKGGECVLLGFMAQGERGGGGRGGGGLLGVSLKGERRTRGGSMCLKGLEIFVPKTETALFQGISKGLAARERDIKN